MRINLPRTEKVRMYYGESEYMVQLELPERVVVTKKQPGQQVTVKEYKVNANYKDDQITAFLKETEKY